MSKSEEIKDKVLTAVLEQLEAGVIPWDKPWIGGGPRNLSTGRNYNGMNAWILTLTGQKYSSNYWVGYNQAKELGGNVKAGERGTHILVPYFEKDADEIKYWGSKVIFNVDQCDGLTIPAANIDAQPIPALDSIYENMPNRPSLQHGGDRAFYRPSDDTVQLPNMDQFGTVESYYQVQFHELAHSTAHASRLNREFVGKSSFGSSEYSKEELIAEFSSAMLSGIVGIESGIERNSAYIQSWLKALKNDRGLLFSAAGDAQRAVNYILGVNREHNQTI